MCLMYIDAGSQKEQVWLDGLVLKWDLTYRIPGDKSDAEGVNPACVQVGRTDGATHHTPGVPQHYMF